MSILLQTQKLQKKKNELQIPVWETKTKSRLSTSEEPQRNCLCPASIAWEDWSTPVMFYRKPGRLLLEFMAASYKATPAQEMSQRVCGWPRQCGLSSIRWGWSELPGGERGKEKQHTHLTSGQNLCLLSQLETSWEFCDGSKSTAIKGSNGTSSKHRT